VTGYYNNPPQEGLVRHYETVARETDANLILYYSPGRTASYLEPDTLVELARIPNIIGLKQAVDFGAPGRYRDDTARVIAETDASKFAVLSGEDDILVELLGLGGVGIISASANIPEVAKAFLGILAAWGRGDRAGAEGIERGILPVIESVFLRKNPIPLAAFFNSPLYLPLVDLRETDGGAEAYARVLEVIETELPSLRKYQAARRTEKARG
jgi:4-hydroxy-tetrahydrodipicolinate synthase